MPRNYNSNRSNIDIRIELRDEAKEQIVELSDRWGMTQVAVLSFLIEWYAQQDETLQYEIVSGLPSTDPAQQAKRIIKNMQGRK